MTAIFLGVFGLLLVMGAPIAASMIGSALVPLLIQGISPILIVQKMFVGVDSFPLMAIPFFMLSGALMDSGGVSKRLIKMISLFFENLPGGLAIISIVASMFFGAISGSIMATVAAIGGIMVPIMLKEGYDERFALATVATSGCLGGIIPPSIVMVIYCVATNNSISDLFLTGFGMGIVLTAGFCVVAFLYGKKHGYYVKEKTKRPFKECIITIFNALPALFMPIIILGGIYSGVFTATEAGNIAVIYGFFVGLFIYKDLKIKDVPKLFVTTARNTAMVLFIIAAATGMGALMTRLHIPETAGNFIISLSSTKIVFLLLVNVLLIIAGCFLETGVAVLLLAPILTPVAMQFGMEPMHFAIVCIVNLIMGHITPPVGVNLFVAAGLRKATIDRVLCPALFAYVLVAYAIILLASYIEPLAIWSFALFGR